MRFSPLIAWVSSCALALGIAVGCSDSNGGPLPTASTLPEKDAGKTPAERNGDGGANTDGGGTRSQSNLRLMAANISSGQTSTYDSGEGIRMFQGLHPDVAFIQEFNYKTNTEEDLAEFVTTAFGTAFKLFRETGKDIPNGIVSRYPILTSGQWVDPEVVNRGFAYAKIDVPGEHPLWAVSVHLLTTGTANRTKEVTALMGKLGDVVGENDYLAIAGDLNTDSRTEGCIATLGTIVKIAGPHPADEAGEDGTNAPREKPYDWVLVDTKLAALQVPTGIGSKSFTSGLVFDSRAYTPLSDVTPIMKGDSEATNMQHMPVLKDFFLAP